MVNMSKKGRSHLLQQHVGHAKKNSTNDLAEVSWVFEACVGVARKGRDEDTSYKNTYTCGQ